MHRLALLALAAALAMATPAQAAPMLLQAAPSDDDDKDRREAKPGKDNSGKDRDDDRTRVFGFRLTLGDEILRLVQKQDGSDDSRAMLQELLLHSIKLGELSDSDAKTLLSRIGSMDAAADDRGREVRRRWDRGPRQHAAPLEVLPGTQEGGAAPVPEPAAPLLFGAGLLGLLLLRRRYR
jgi:hypothetical protein